MSTLKAEVVVLSGGGEDESGFVEAGSTRFVKFITEPLSKTEKLVGG